MATDNKMRNIFILSAVVISIFGYLDSVQIKPWQMLGNWDLYNQFVSSSIVHMWLLALVAVAIGYYIVVKDKSEAVGIFVSGAIMLYGGLEDLMFFLLSNNCLNSQMCWFTGTQTFISKLFGLSCVTPLTLMLNVIVAMIISWYVLKWFWRQKW